MRRFGTGVLGADGRLDRDALGRLVFKDADARRDLEAIVHPEVYAGIRALVRRAVGRAAPAVVAEIPLLYETDHAGDFDRVVVAACSRDEQKRRVMARDGLSEAEVERRLDRATADRRQAPARRRCRGHGRVTGRDRDGRCGEIWEKHVG